MSLSTFIDEYGGLLGGSAGLGLLLSAYNRLEDVGDDATTGMGELAETQMEQTAFRPYTVTSATGSQFGITQDPTTGQFQYGLEMSPEEQAFQQGMFGGAGQFFEGAQLTPEQLVDREDVLFERIRQAQRPQERMERLGLEERLAAQGRLGVSTNLYGGTPDQLAMERAQQESIARARINAMDQARAEQAQQVALGQQFLGASYLPQAQLLSAITPGMSAAGQQQQAQMYGAGLFGEATASGLEALLGASLGQANLAGALGGGLLSGALGSDYKFDIPTA
jgi:hypothetical protein